MLYSNEEGEVQVLLYSNEEGEVQVCYILTSSKVICMYGTVSLKRQESCYCFIIIFFLSKTNSDEPIWF